MLSVDSYQLNRSERGNKKTPPSANKQEGEFKVANLNIRTACITDLEENLHLYPQYAWRKRLKPIKQLILKDAPIILALSELNLIQVRDLKKAFEDTNYELIAYNSSTKESNENEHSENKAFHHENNHHSEFIGFLFDSTEVQLEEHTHIVLPKEERQRILMEGKFYHIASKVSFVVLTTHFDHKCLDSRKESAQQELEIIHRLEEKNIPWFSIGDRNWFHDMEGQECAQEYIKHSHICDFRDENELGSYGPSGTFPAHLGEQEEYEPKIIELEDGEEYINAMSLDIGFRSRNLIEGVNYYAYSGEFCPKSHELLPCEKPGKLREKNFVSDHYYIGGIFRFKSLQTKDAQNSQEGQGKSSSL